MHGASMSTAIARSVVHIISMTMMFILILIPVIAAKESSSLSPLSAPPDSQVSLHQKEYYHVQLNLKEDYGNWNPTPISGGTGPAPIPHASCNSHPNIFHSRDSSSTNPRTP